MTRRRWVVRWLAGLAGVLVLWRPAAAYAIPELPRSAVSPLPSAPARGFDPPAQPWLSGHRGVDLPGQVGAGVRAAAGGRVAYAGTIAGRGVLVIEHGAVRTTYEPVRSLVAVGTQVVAGQEVATLEPGHPCGGSAACLHWGLKAGEAYLDPMLMLGSSPQVRLLPAEAATLAAARAREREAAAGSAAVSARAGGRLGLVRPAPGEVTSPFGQRLHPILKVWKLHDGVDFGTGCGAALVAGADGVVTEAGYNRAYGNRLLIDHGVIGGHRVVTSYNHASGYVVGGGARVRRGQVLGRSGSTGYSTGCHLHYQMWIDGALVNPMEWL